MQIYVNGNAKKIISMKTKIIDIQISKVKIKRLDNTEPTIEIERSGAVYLKPAKQKFEI